MMKTIIYYLKLPFFRFKVWWLHRRAVTEKSYSYATVQQLMKEYDMYDQETKANMLEWVKDPSNPNPNAIYFYRNVMRFCKLFLQKQRIVHCSNNMLADTSGTNVQ